MPYLLPAFGQKIILLSMRYFLAALLLAVPFMTDLQAQSPQQLAEFWTASRISDRDPSDMRHSDVKRHVGQLKQRGVKIEEVGRSLAGREIYQMEWGRGPLRVFMWSQMHGDEPTATPALFDLFSFLEKSKELPWVKQIGEKITLRAVPMLNPDGAELYQRRNLQGIDINRDAVNLTTPEGRLLKTLRDDWNPEIGFNLHNQQELTTVGRSPRQAAISFLVVFGDPDKTLTDGQARNQRITSAMVNALNQFISGHIGRYGDEWTPTAFGDNFGAWGTPSILIETGALHGRDGAYLVKMNFVAFLTALNSIATGSEARESPTPYLALPENGSGVITHIVFRRGGLVSETGTFIGNGDIAVRYERRRASFVPSGKITVAAGPISLTGLDEFDASGFVIRQRFGKMRNGELAELLFYKRDRNVNWNAENIETAFPPDAVFSAGKWVKGEGVVPRNRRQ